MSEWNEAFAFLQTLSSMPLVPSGGGGGGGAAVPAAGSFDEAFLFLETLTIKKVASAISPKFQKLLNAEEAKIAEAHHAKDLRMEALNVKITALKKKINTKLQGTKKMEQREKARISLRAMEKELKGLEYHGGTHAPPVGGASSEFEELQTQLAAAKAQAAAAKAQAAAAEKAQIAAKAQAAAAKAQAAAAEKARKVAEEARKIAEKVAEDLTTKKTPSGGGLPPPPPLPGGGPPAGAGPDRGGLLAAIRGGATLNKISEIKGKGKGPSDGNGGGGGGGGGDGGGDGGGAAAKPEQAATIGGSKQHLEDLTFKAAALTARLQGPGLSEDDKIFIQNQIKTYEEMIKEARQRMEASKSIVSAVKVAGQAGLRSEAPEQNGHTGIWADKSWAVTKTNDPRKDLLHDYALEATAIDAKMAVIAPFMWKCVDNADYLLQLSKGTFATKETAALYTVQKLKTIKDATDTISDFCEGLATQLKLLTASLSADSKENPAAKPTLYTSPKHTGGSTHDQIVATRKAHESDDDGEGASDPEWDNDDDAGSGGGGGTSAGAGAMGSQPSPTRMGGKQFKKAKGDIFKAVRQFVYMWLFLPVCIGRQLSVPMPVLLTPNHFCYFGSVVLPFFSALVRGVVILFH